MSHFLYLVAHEECDFPVSPIKVGITASLEIRLRSLQTGNPSEIGCVFAFEVPDRLIARQLEKAFHHLQDEHRMSGEWFDIPVYEALRLLCIYLETAITEEIKDEGLAREIATASGLARAKRLVGLETVQ